MDHEDVSARTVNIHRQILHSVFEHARRRDTFGLRYNPVADTGKRPEEGARPVETFEPHEIRAVADAARSGIHRGRGGYKHSKFTSETDREWARINEQDAALFLVAAFTGLRLGELPALHWADVDLDRRILSVSRSMSAGEESSTKSRRARSVPLADQAASELHTLSRGQHFTAATTTSFADPMADRSTGLPCAPALSRHRMQPDYESGGFTICATASAASQSSDSTSSPSRT